MLFPDVPFPAAGFPPLSMPEVDAGSELRAAASVPKACAKERAAGLASINKKPDVAVGMQSIHNDLVLTLACCDAADAQMPAADVHPLETKRARSQGANDDSAMFD